MEAAPFRVQAFADGDAAEGALVQILRIPRDEPASVVRAPVRTDSLGYARFRLPQDEAPDDGHLEVVLLEEWGYARVLVPLDLEAGYVEAGQRVVLPARGSLVFDLTDLPREARPEYVGLLLFPAGEAHRDIVPSLPPPTPEVGLQRMFPKHLTRVPVQESGRTTPIRIPADHAVAPSFEPREPGWMMVAQSYTGPSVGTRPSILVLVVRAGVDETYESNWTRLPGLHVRVADGETGEPVPNAEVIIGLRPDGARSRRFVRAYRTEARGELHTNLTLGTFQPAWSLIDAEVVVMALAPGYRTQMAVLPFAWDAIRADLRLTPDSGRTWYLRGRVTWKDGTAAAHNQLSIGPVSLSSTRLPVTTDAEGRFEVDLDESLAPLFFEDGWGMASIRRLPHVDHEDGRTFKIGFGSELGETVITIPADPSEMEDLDLVLRREPQ